MEIRPTAEAIERVLAEITDSDGTTDCTPLWYISAYNEVGELQGIGTGLSLEDAVAGAWINVHLPGDEIGQPISTATSQVVPRRIPDGWIFEIDDMPCLGQH